MNEKSTVSASSTNAKEELDGMLDKYFELRRWDKKTSFPYLSTLAPLGLEDVGGEL